ncbi:hypothetical protein HN873_071170 [Arachis hypogaea]
MPNQKQISGKLGRISGISDNIDETEGEIGGHVLCAIDMTSLRSRITFLQPDSNISKEVSEYSFF